MNAFTLRLPSALAKKLDRYCKNHGYKKTGFLEKLIESHLDQNSSENFAASTAKQNTNSRFKNLVGIVRLGGNAVEDCEDFAS